MLLLLLLQIMWSSGFPRFARPPIHREFQKRLQLEPWVHRARKTILSTNGQYRPQFVVENSNLTATSAFPALAVLRPKPLAVYTAATSPSKHRLRAVFVAHGNPAMGLSLRQVRPKTPISPRRRAKRITDVELSNGQATQKICGKPAGAPFL
jgi:hypothetical protein